MPESTTRVLCAAVLSMGVLLVPPVCNAQADLAGILEDQDSWIAPQATSATVPSTVMNTSRPRQQVCRLRPGSYTPPPVRPAPTQSTAYIQQLVDRFGLIDIRGSLATVQELQRMEGAFVSLPRACFQNLRISIERDNGRIGDTGYWCPIDATGNNITADEDPDDCSPAFAGGHIYYFGPQVARWIYVHEVAHHVTIYQDAQLGHNLLDSLGYQITSTSRSTDPRKWMQFITNWDRNRVPVSSIPTRYSRDHPQEHLAELIAYHFASDDREYGEVYLPGFRMPPAILRLIILKFGADPRS